MVLKWVHLQYLKNRFRQINTNDFARVHDVVPQLMRLFNLSVADLRLRRDGHHITTKVSYHF
ncbi:hypothetical protein HYN51_06460 [Limnobaculum parvum]|uniref:Uncharacterized protein n=1 Tax=Limnobaculum parvum TaxID=2172103 RepID=A0A2Y9TXF1_9GAMM|nr:hypothetical protein HYN51_06460 [Limnobaculum parvum]